jgi:peptide deformylase
VHEGLLARILQHEIDHLDRTLFIDRLPRRRRWLLAPRLAWMAWTRGARS